EQRLKSGISADDWMAGLSVKDRQGAELDIKADLCEQQFPVAVKFPKVVTELTRAAPGPDCFPLTFTFKEYVITIDKTLHGDTLPALRDTFCITSEGKLLVDEGKDVGLVGLWKDHKTGVQLHPGDWIIEVNGVKGSAEELLEQLGSHDVLKIRLHQQGSVFRFDVYDANNETRKRLGDQTKPRQIEL
ncbi:unnamed protein product, partial [Polarella glacialis]